MSRSNRYNSAEAASEVAVVDTLTKLVFQEVSYSADEQGIIAALRHVDVNLSMDNTQDMGSYLRALGVSEMIELVRSVREHLRQEALPQSPAVPRVASRDRPGSWH